jgi:hypothetical protein
MNLTLYRYDGERNRVDKTPHLTGASETLGFNYIYEAYDPNETDLKLKTGNSMSAVEVDMYNYASDGERWYYLTHRYDEKGNLVFHIKCDPLMTFKDAIDKLKVFAVRSNKGDANLSTDNFTPMKQRFVSEYRGDAVPTTGWFVLVCAGSAGTAPEPSTETPTVPISIDSAVPLLFSIETETQTQSQT